MKKTSQKQNISDEYIIEKILKTNKNKMYVKWKGYNSSFNSWIDKNTVTKYIFYLKCLLTYYCLNKV